MCIQEKTFSDLVSVYMALTSLCHYLKLLQIVTGNQQKVNSEDLNESYLQILLSLESHTYVSIGWLYHVLL